MTKPWPTPNINPFKRLHVTDGLLINTERWQLAHEYHRKRQNVHYQSLNQPGIVCDLGVCAIEPPGDIQAKYRDGRWVQIQPGIAIDLFGNIIVVPEPIDFHISSEVIGEEFKLVYIVVSYVDPGRLLRSEAGEIVTETFRIDEKNSPPDDWEVEVCRILVKPGEVQLVNSVDVFSPHYNQLDLRYRQQARSRPQYPLRIGTIASNNDSESDRIFLNLSYLMQSVASLYPAMQGSNEIAQVKLNSNSVKDEIFKYDLLYMTSQHSLSLISSELESLKQYLEAGGTLLVEALTKGTKVEELIQIKQEISEAIVRITATVNAPGSIYQKDELAELQNTKTELENELLSTESEIEAKLSDITLFLRNFAEQLGTSLEDLKQLNRNHPLRTRPFLFAALPIINAQEVKILTGGGIVFVIGNLSSAWGLDERLSLPRETIRTAQEMGINILNFAWQRRHLTQLQMGTKEV